MKLQFVCYDNIDVIKSNLDSWVNKFKQPSSDWLSEELDQPLFSDTKFKEIKDFSLDMSADPKKAFLTEADKICGIAEASRYFVALTIHRLRMSGFGLDFVWDPSGRMFNTVGESTKSVLLVQ